MLDAYDLDLLGSEARSVRFYILFRIPEDERKTNEDMKQLAFIDQEVVKSKFAPYLDYKAIDEEISKIRKKYQALPDLRFAQAKANVDQIQQKAKLVA